MAPGAARRLPAVCPRIGLALAALLGAPCRAQEPQERVSVHVDWDVNGGQYEPPLFKRYGVMNSGLLDGHRYNASIFDSLRTVRADSLVVDLYLGTSNPDARFRGTIGGPTAAVLAGNGSIEQVTFDFGPLDILARGLHGAGVWPYWAYTYSPAPFQPVLARDRPSLPVDTPTLPPDTVIEDDLTRCPGFDDFPDHYSCRPQPQYWANCWKCPPKDPDGRGYTAFQAVSRTFARHWREIGVPVYEEVWNEPDLTDFYDAVTTVTMFLGNAKDYTDMYLAAAQGMLEGDPDTIVGGPGIAYNINTDRRLHPTAQRPNGGDMMVGAAQAGMPVDFFSFHVVSPCLYEPVCNVTWVFEVRAQWSRYALTQPEVVAPEQEGRFNTTELHCTEYYPAARVSELVLPFVATPALPILMLNDFLTFLGETDVTKVHWAQYMEVDPASNGTGLVDFDGNARPSWHAFRFWGDLPLERKAVKVSHGFLNAVSAFDRRTCHGGVLLWNNGTAAARTRLTVAGIPFSGFTVQAYQLDEAHMPGPGFEPRAPTVYTDQYKDAEHIYTFPPAGAGDEEGLLTIPTNGTLYLNITGAGCPAISNAANPLPEGEVLKPHYYFGFRPCKTWLYSEWDRRTWSAHLGMGNETHGLALAGATVRVPRTQSFNISMDLLDGKVGAGGVWGLRVDFWDDAEAAYAPEASLFFYDHEQPLPAPVQVPRLWGSLEDVPPDNFLPRTLRDFAFAPASPAYRAPRGWDGKLTLLFVLKDGTPGAKVQAYVRGPAPDYGRPSQLHRDLA